MIKPLCKFISSLLLTLSLTAEEKQDMIVNGIDWFDTEGRKISAHEGELAHTEFLQRGPMSVSKKTL